ncbi:MAG: hypothetical protein HYT87_08175 [Nitrospirae bacterium]|nr:hypothetical protein [Nitrospirota bacterium]
MSRLAIVSILRLLLLDQEIELSAGGFEFRIPFAYRFPKPPDGLFKVAVQLFDFSFRLAQRIDLRGGDGDP